MILDIENKYNEIKQDIIDNQQDVFNLRNYYSRKYSNLSDRLNDVCVGLFLNDEYKPTVQIFIRNKTGYIRSQFIFNNECNKIISYNNLNYKING